MMVEVKSSVDVWHLGLRQVIAAIPQEGMHQGARIVGAVRIRHCPAVYGDPNIAMSVIQDRVTIRQIVRRDFL